MEYNATEVGYLIKFAREKQGLTQKQLAELCGMGEAQIGKYERGERRAKLETLSKIALALDVSLNFFLDKNQKGNFAVIKNYLESKDRTSYIIEKNNLTHIVKVLQDMGYFFIIDLDKKDLDDITIYEKNDNSNNKNKFLINLSKDELIKLEEESDDFLKYKLQSLINKQI